MWEIVSGKNDGYPIWQNGISSPAVLWVGNLPSKLWRIVRGVNDDYPYKWYQIAVQSGYIYTDNADIGSDASLRDYIDGGTGDNINDIIKYNGDDILPDFTSPRSILGDAFTTFYGLSVYDVLDVANALGNAPSSFWDALGTTTDNKYTNLIPYVVGFKWYPFHIPDIADTQISEIQFGFSSDAKISLTGTQGYESYKIKTAEKTYYHGQLQIPTKFDSPCFLDYEPFTNTEIYLPYIGVVTVHARDIVGHIVTCRSVIDLSSGMITYFIANENYTIYQGSAQIGSDIMLAGNDIYSQSQKYVSAVMQSASNAVRGSVNIVGSIITKNPFEISGAVLNTAKNATTDAISIADAKHGIPQTVGNGSGFGATFCNPYPSIMIKRPAVTIPSSYGHSTGYVCNYTSKLSNVSGYTVIANPDLSDISESPEMMSELFDILTTGFYA